MWIVWLLLVLVTASLLVHQSVLVLRDGPTRISEELSIGQRRFVEGLRLLGAIGAAIVWGALIYVLIDVDVWYWIQPAHKGPQLWALAYSLIYTSFVLNSMQITNWKGPYQYWRPSSQLWMQAI